MSVRKIRATWWVDIWTGVERFRRKSPLNSRTGALEYERTLRHRLAMGERLDDLPPDVPAFSDFSKAWLAGYVRANHKPSDYNSKESILRVHLAPAFGHLRLDKITSEVVERYKADKLAGGMSKKTLNNTLHVLAKCLRIATEWGQLSAMPTIRRIKVISERTDYLNDEEASRLLGTRESMWSLMAAVALFTGMRFSELTALRWNDLDLGTGLLSIRRAYSAGVLEDTKTYRSRHLPVPDALVERLLRARRAGGLLFPGQGDGPVTYSAAVYHLRKLCDEAGIRRVRWHVLRHTCASLMVCNDVSIFTVQKVLGHSTVSTTERYAHLAPGRLRHAVDVLARVTSPQPRAMAT